MLGKIEVGASRMESLIRDLLEYSRAGEAAGQGLPESADLNVSLQQALTAGR
jgi:signal transduction histidine kinase